MSDHPTLTPDAVREWVGDFEIGKGRPYAEGAAVFGCVRAGDVLRACVRGTRVRPYRVAVQVGDGVRAANCTCPVGSDTPDAARCKHVAAVLLAYLEAPGRFADAGDAAANLTAREKPELVALVLELLRRAPELEPLLAAPLPGGGARTPAGREFWFWQAAERIRGVNLANDWAAREVAEGLTELHDTAAAFRYSGDTSNADAVVAGLRDALLRELAPEQRRQVLDALPDAVRTDLAPPEPRDVVEPPF